MMKRKKHTRKSFKMVNVREDLEASTDENFEKYQKILKGGLPDLS
jgi:hypothetical protein